MKLKVCGMRELKNIAAVSNLHPDYMGFIFWAPSSRFVSEVTPALEKNIKKTGVFVNAPLDYIKRTIKTHQLKAVQLHGQETPDYCNMISDFGIEIIKAFSIKNSFDFSILNNYEKCCDFFLFDSKGTFPGGNGIEFDWRILNGYASKKPFFLSGGIGLENIHQIKELLKINLPLYAIDVNSKFEVIPGLKKIEELTKFKNELYEL